MPRTVVHSLAELQAEVDAQLAERVEQRRWHYDGPRSVYETAGLHERLLAAAPDNHRAAVDSIQLGREQKGATVTITLTVVYRETAAQYAAVMEKLRTLSTELLRPTMSAHEQLLVIHDWLVANVAYDQTRAASTAYDGVIRGSTVCAGYAQATAYWCALVGIPVRIVNGEASETRTPHAWNMVCLDGTWYHLDVTWDRPGSDAPHTHAAYSYYLLSDAEISTDHTPISDPGESALPPARVRYADALTAALHAKHPASGFLRTVPQRIGLMYTEPRYTVVGVPALADFLTRMYQQRTTQATMRFVPAHDARAEFQTAWQQASAGFYGVGCSLSVSLLPYHRAGGMRDVLLGISITWQG
jgi:hypothetical protein